ncbi:MAG TPA: FAD-dependent oxidoreductase, partial [Microbacteriaceae bacterium]|nr:FAD-dependent oxidoreductase [Microbacteriaceae bacterium]
DRFVNPVIAGVHGVSADRIIARDVLAPVVAALPEAGSLTAAVARVRADAPRPGAAIDGLRGGMARLVVRLSDELQARGVDLVLETEVASVDHSREGFAVKCFGRTWQCDALTLACGLDESARLLQVSHGMSTPSTLDSAVVVLAVDSEALDAVPLGSGALIAAGTGLLAKAVTHVSAKWAWVAEQLPASRHIVRLSYGRDGIVPNGDLVELGVREFGILLGGAELEVRDAVVTRWREGVSRRSSETVAAVSRLAAAARERDIELCGAFQSGNGLTPLVSDHYRRVTHDPVRD